MTGADDDRDASRTDKRWERQCAVSEMIKNWVEVAAFVIGGIWVVMVFGLQSCPAREKQFTWDSELTWSDSPVPDTCLANWHMSIKNISARSIDIRRVDVRLWTYPLSAPSGGRPAYVDAEALRPKDASGYFYQRTFVDPDDPLVDEYAPNGVSDNEYEWVIPRPGKPTWLSLEVELYEDKAGKRSVWYGSETSQLCPPVQAQ